MYSYNHYVLLCILFLIAIYSYQCNYFHLRSQMYLVPVWFRLKHGVKLRRRDWLDVIHTISGSWWMVVLEGYCALNMVFIMQCIVTMSSALNQWLDFWVSVQSKDSWHSIMIGVLGLLPFILMSEEQYLRDRSVNKCRKTNFWIMCVEDSLLSTVPFVWFQNVFELHTYKRIPQNWNHTFG